ncbi:MAG: winged helix-turn-helix transcriptional regulator [Candidatus Wukongarchaeota archaeon]|nr:helix-turn-helix domain-containing protein [Candidatus Wukongarchaeota archaeon]
MPEELCPVKETIKIIGKKWYLIIIFELTKKPKGFNELKESVKGISSKVLSESLKKLTEKEIVQRKIYSESPIRVEYSLTEKGLDLKAIFDDMRKWGVEWSICDEVDQIIS